LPFIAIYRKHCTQLKIIYENWIPAVNNSLTLIDSVEKVNENNFYVFTAGGYPAIFSAIDNAIEDILAYSNFNRLVISVDSDEITKEQKYKK
ncbi:MAG: hypothetical protein WBW94_06700, partial [Anaerolineales bacterium]